MITTEREFHSKVRHLNQSLIHNDTAMTELLIKDEKHPVFIRTSPVSADCLQCQSEVDIDENGGFVCPSCGLPYKMIDMTNWEAAKHQRAGYFCILDILDDILVLRCWEFNLKYSPTYNIKGSYVNEICRYWFSPNGYERITRVPKYMGLYFYFMRPCILLNKRDILMETIANNSLLIQYPKNLKAFHIDVNAKLDKSVGILNKIRTCLNTVHNSCK